MYSIQSLLIQDKDTTVLDNSSVDTLPIKNEPSSTHVVFSNPSEATVSHETVRDSPSPEHKTPSDSPVVPGCTDAASGAPESPQSPVGKFHDIDLSTFQRKRKKTPLGFGARSFPPRVSEENRSHFHFRSVPISRVEDRNDAKPGYFSRQDKLSNGHRLLGFIVNKTFRPRHWKLSSLSVPLLDGGDLVHSRYEPEENPCKIFDNIPYKDVRGLNKRYRVSTVVQPFVRPCAPITMAPITQIRQSQSSALTQSLLKKNLNSKSKARVMCTVPNCNKDFADRSSLQRHKRRLHPELF